MFPNHHIPTKFTNLVANRYAMNNMIDIGIKFGQTDAQKIKYKKVIQRPTENRDGAS